MQKIVARSDHANYSIYVDEKSVNELPYFILHNKYKKVVLISDKKLSKYRNEIKKKLKLKKIEFFTLEVPGEESTKDFKKVYPLYGKLLKFTSDRNTLLIALGGGVIGDTVGFLAATFMRGIDWVNIPTTLLAQVDSSIGGKTGVNHEQGKNLIGSFYPPKAVFIQANYLKTLSKRELMSGFGETIKYGFLMDRYFFHECINNLSEIMSLENETLNEVIYKSVKWKSAVVSNDERDKSGLRQVLNFGHTFGHALEQVTKFKKFKHGEAIIWGMRFATIVSFKKGILNLQDFNEAMNGLEKLKVPAIAKEITLEKLWNAMLKDKKNQDGQVHMVLIENIGRPVANQIITKAEFKESYKILLGLS